MHSAVTAAVAALVVVFIGMKSTAPLLELFSPSPWLHYYDEYFFVNSQGVFGFINQRRAQPVLFYTHGNVDTLNVTCTDDPAGPGLAGQNGDPLRCSDAVEYCAHSHFGSIIQTHCPRTCGSCKQPRKQHKVALVHVKGQMLIGPLLLLLKHPGLSVLQSADHCPRYLG